MSNPNNSQVNANTTSYANDDYTPDPYATAGNSLVDAAKVVDNTPVDVTSNPPQVTDFSPASPVPDNYVANTYPTADASLVHEARVIDSAPVTSIANPPVAEVREFKQSEPIIPSTKTENPPIQANTVSQEHSHNSTTSLNPSEDEENNIPAAIFETISSKLNPIAQKFGKGVGQLRQV